MRRLKSERRDTRFSGSRNSAPEIMKKIGTEKRSALLIQVNCSQGAESGGMACHSVIAAWIMTTAMIATQRSTSKYSMRFEAERVEGAPFPVCRLMPTHDNKAGSAGVAGIDRGNAAPRTERPADRFLDGERE